MAIVPVFSAARCSRRDAVIGNRTSSPTTAARPPNAKPSSIEARTSSSRSLSQKMTRSGWRPACETAGKNRSGLVRHQSTLPFIRAGIPATIKAAAAPSTVPVPPPANSCRAPQTSPPPGRAWSISGTPNGKIAGFRPMPPSRCAMRSLRSDMMELTLIWAMAGRHRIQFMSRQKRSCSLFVPNQHVSQRECSGVFS